MSRSEDNRDEIIASLEERLASEKRRNYDLYVRLCDIQEKYIRMLYQLQDADDRIRKLGGNS